MNKIQLRNLLDESKKIAGKPTSKNKNQRTVDDDLAKDIKRTFENFAKSIVQNITGWDSGKNATSSSFYPGGKNSNPYKKYLWHFFKPKNHPNQDLCLLVVYINLNPLEDNIFISIGLHDARNSDKYREHLIGRQCEKEIYDFLEQEFKLLDFKNNFRRENRKLIYTKTLADTSVDDFENLFNNLIPIYESAITKFPYLDQDLPCSIASTDGDMKNKSNLDNNENTCISNLPLNQILYGPPGTGKTYNTINKALEIIFNINTINKDKKDIETELVIKATAMIDDKEKKIDIDVDKKDDKREKLKQVFNFFSERGQIEFVTFHQSYGYEEFVEGIKPCNLEKCGNGNNNIEYSVQPGIFKKLSMKANESYPIEFLLEKPTSNTYAKMIQDDVKVFRLLEGSKIKKTNTDSFTYQDVKDLFLEKAKYRDEDEFYILEEDYIFQSKSASSSVVLGRSSNGQTEWKKVKNTTIGENTNKNVINNMNYVLIIDEINRGNISKIFGELITLIEPSKRIGEDEEIRVKLPYSGDTEESFGVPKNLFIIGTMNTADRSIAPIDTALRRRFDFIEMAPNPDKLEVKLTDSDVNLQKMLTAINTRIEYIYDRDHTIGHSYFMGVKTLDDLKEVFKNNIIPLLAEYFHEDWENIKLILNDEDYKGEGNKFIEIESKNDSYLSNLKTKNYIPSDKKIYKIGKSWDKCLFKNIYNENCKIQVQK